MTSAPKPRERVLSHAELKALWNVLDGEGIPWGPSVKLLVLTKAGAAILRDIVPWVEKAQARMLQPLKPADRKLLLGLLTQLVDLNNESSRVPLRAEDALEHLGKSG